MGRGKDIDLMKWNETMGNALQTMSKMQYFQVLSTNKFNGQ